MESLDGLLQPPAEPAAGLDTQLMRGALQARLFDREAAPVKVDRFEIAERIGQGGMGTVYAAYDPRLDRRVALKLMRRDGPGGDRTARLLREARALAQLTHPNVVTVYDSGIVDDEVFIAMELLDGGSLATWCSEHPPRTRADVARTLEIFVAAGRGLAAAHAAGLVHRDFKPANVLLGKDGRLKVGDFGLARMGGATDSAMPTRDDGDLQRTASRGGGTPAYMAPEQFTGTADARSDQFSFCVAVWEALWGARPFLGISLVSSIEGDRPSIARSGVPVPRRVHAALLRGLAAQPGARWPDMIALLEAIDPAARIARMRRRWVLGLGAIAAVAIVRPWERNEPPCARPEDALAGTWDAAARERLRTGFAALDVPLAADTWTRLEPALDEYVDGWWRVRDEACAATLERRERSSEAYDLTMSCLERRRQALGAVVLAMRDIDAQTAAKSLDAVRGLPAVEPCADADARRELVALPQDVGLRTEVEDVQRGLARVEAELALGHLDIAKDELAVVGSRSDALGRAPLRAEAQFLRGQLLVASLDNQNGCAAFEDALELAALAGDDELVARTWPRLITCVGERLSDPTRALAWEMPAILAVRRAGDAPLARAELHDAIGIVLMRVPDPERAEREHASAHALRREHLPEGDPRLDSSINGLASAAMMLGRADETAALHRQVIDLRVRGHGEHHPLVAHARYNLAATLGQLGRYDEALPELRAALRIHERAYGEDHVQVALTLAALGPILLKSDALDEAIATVTRAAAICERVAEAHATDCAFVYANVGTVLDWAGRTSEAIVAQQRAVDLLESIASPEISVLAVALTNLASTRAALGDDESAQAGLVRVIALYERSLGPDAAPLWHPLLRLARLHRERGRNAEALPFIQRASAIIQAHPIAPLRMSDIEYEHLLVRWALGLRDAETRAVAERAREHAAAAESPDDVELINRWLEEHPLPGQHP